MNQKILFLLLPTFLYGKSVKAVERQEIASSHESPKQMLTEMRTHTEFLRNHIEIFKKMDKLVNGQEWRRDIIKELDAKAADIQTTYALKRANDRCTGWKNVSHHLRLTFDALYNQRNLNKKTLQKAENLLGKIGILTSLYQEDFKKREDKEEAYLYNEYFSNQSTFFNEISFLGYIKKFANFVHFNSIRLPEKSKPSLEMQAQPFQQLASEELNSMMGMLVEQVNFIMALSSPPKAKKRNVPLTPLFEGTTISSLPLVDEQKNIQEKAEHIAIKFETPLMQKVIDDLQHAKRGFSKKYEKKAIKEKFQNLNSAETVLPINNLSLRIEDPLKHSLNKLAYAEVVELLKALRIPHRAGDNKIVATNPFDYQKTLVIHTHGKTFTEDQGIIKATVEFLQTLKDNL